MSFKRILSFLLCLVLAVTVVGCSGGSQPDTSYDESYDDSSFVGAVLEGTVWEFGPDYVGFGPDEQLVAFNMDSEQTHTGTYYWDGRYGQLNFEGGTFYYIEAYEDDLQLENFLYFTDADNNTAEYTRCAEIPDGMELPSAIPDTPEPPSSSSSSENNGGNGGNDSWDIPESLRPSFTGNLSVDESRLGENLGGSTGGLGSTCWMIGDDIYTFFDDGFVDAFNLLVGGTAIGTYDVSGSTVTCLMDNGAQVIMQYDGSSLQLDGQEMMSMFFSNERESPHLFQGVDSMIGSAWHEASLSKEYCFLADDILLLYDSENYSTEIGSYHWNDDGTGVISISGSTLPITFRNAYLYVDFPSGRTPLHAVHPEQLSIDFLGMERVLLGDWTWSQDPSLVLDIILVGASYYQGNDDFSLSADKMAYDGRTLTLTWPDNDGLFKGQMTGRLAADGCLYFDGWDGCFIRN